MTRPAPPAPPYAGPAKYHGDDRNKPIRRIVLHSTVSPCVPGGAQNVARYFRTTVVRPSSAHYVVDPLETLQVVYDSTVAYHAPPNEHSLGVEMCDMPTQNLARWDDANHRLMLERTAELVAGLCLAYAVPPYYVDARRLAAGKSGVTTHASVSLAFGETDHWDPGAWPRRRFMRRVRAIMRDMEASR
jgi:hypothetical protein